MNKILSSILIMLCLIFAGYEILSESNTIILAVNYSFNIWINNLFPSLFPFFVLSELLINYGFIELLSELFKPLFEKVFKINGNAAFVFFMSMLSGFPSNSKYAKELVLQKKLTEIEATKILMFSHFSNPLFILGTISLTFLNDKKLGILILISHYVANIVIGLLIRNYNKKEYNSKFSFKKAILSMHKKRMENSTSFGGIITSSLTNSINTLLIILGVVTTFLIITTIIDNNFHLNIYSKIFISSFLEITQGLKHISLLSISNYYKAILILAVISFGGLSVHTQMISIIGNTKIKYLPFFIARIFHVFISIIIFIFLEVVL